MTSICQEPAASSSLPITPGRARAAPTRSRGRASRPPRARNPPDRSGCQVATRMAIPVPTARVSWRIAARVQDDGRRRRAPREAKAAKIPKRKANPAAKRNVCSPDALASLDASMLSRSPGRVRGRPPRAGALEARRRQRRETCSMQAASGRAALGTAFMRGVSRFLTCLSTRMNGGRRLRHSSRSMRKASHVHGSGHMRTVNRLPSTYADRPRGLAEVETIAWLLDNSIPVPGTGVDSASMR